MRSETGGPADLPGMKTGWMFQGDREGHVWFWDGKEWAERRLDQVEPQHPEPRPSLWQRFVGFLRGD